MAKRTHAAEQGPCAKRVHPMLTRSVTTHNTRVAVLETHELLEGILLALPTIADLLRLRRVSRAWHAVITTSKPLQQKLFLRPAPARGPAWILKIGADQPLEPTSLPITEIPHDCYHSQPSTLNPFLFSFPPVRPSLRDRAHLCEPVYVRYVPPLPDLFDAKVGAAMYLTQPPVTEAQVHVTLVPREKRGNKKKGVKGMGTTTTTGKAKGKAQTKMLQTRVAIKNPQGVRFGDLVVQIAKAVGHARMARYKGDVAVRKDGARSVVWIVGAVFASEEERMLVERGEPGEGT